MNKLSKQFNKQEVNTKFCLFRHNIDSFCSTNKNRKNLKILVLENMVSVLQNYKCYKINTRKITNMRTNCEKGTITHQTLKVQHRIWFKSI